MFVHFYMERNRRAIARVRAILLKWSVTIAMFLRVGDVECELAAEEKTLSRKVFTLFSSSVLYPVPLSE